MFEQYLNQIMTMDLFADSISVFDKDGRFVFYRKYKKGGYMPSLNDSIIGMHLREIFPDIDPEKSTILKALKGEPSFGVVESYTDYSGNLVETIEDIYPIYLGDSVIGAACVSRDRNEHMTKISLESVSSADPASEQIIGRSPEIMHLKQQIRELGATNANVLIYGETGTGKELVARALHRNSLRHDKAFFSQNCAAIPHELLESLFFGTERGVYTGAVERAGILEQADKGTIFLDEVNSLNLGLQAKLLKALEEKSFRRLGSVKEIHSNFRVLSATNEDPMLLINEKKIRSDLFYRIGSVVIEVPPLRVRKSDIPILAEHFIDRVSEGSDEMIVDISDEAMDILMEYSWPGNVRELRNVVETAVIFSKGGVIRPENFPKYILTGSSFKGSAGYPKVPAIGETGNYSYTLNKERNEDVSSGKHYTGFGTDLAEASVRDYLLNHSLSEIEELTIRLSLENDSNHTRSAERLGITRQTLISKIKKYGM